MRNTMLDLPKSTEMNKQLPKKALFTKFQMNTAAKNKVDSDISKMTIVNEISPEKIHIAEGEQVKTFFVIKVTLKRKDFAEQTIATISKLIPQNVLLALEYENEVKLAIYHTKLLQSEWGARDNTKISIRGLNLDAVWQNIVTQIGDIEIEDDNTLDEQIEVDEKKEKLDREINRLKKLANKEKQPKKKYEYAKNINEFTKELEEM